MQIYWTKINKIIDETSEVKTFLLDCPEDFTWEEGSITHLALSGFNAGEKQNSNLIRHMSINTLPYEESIGITTRIKETSSEFKTALKYHQVGDEVALFKTRCNVPLRREDKNIYLLSSGVGLTAFRPLVLNYFESADNVTHLHSLSIDSANDFLFPNIFESRPDKSFTSHIVDNRKNYYEEVEKLATDKDGLFYILGSDEFLVQNIEVLIGLGIKAEQIMIDKKEKKRSKFLSIDVPI